MASSHADVKFEKPGHVEKLSTGNLEFALDLYKEITTSQGNGTNAFFSPLSVTIALSMTTAGARNNTAAELKKTLKLDVLEKDEDIHAAFKEILSNLNPAAGAAALPFTLYMANRIYVEQTYKLEADFLTMLAEKYSAGAATTNFIKEMEKARLEINSWVEKITKDKIKDLLPEGVLNDLTRAVLVNAIYFKGTWKSQFDIEKSYDGQFLRSADDQITARMMYKKARYPFAEVDKFGCKILELPYTGDRLSMLLVLPNEVDGLAALEANLTAESFRFLVSSLTETKVKVTLPKFKLEIGSSIKPVLNKLGIRDAFCANKADFTGMSVQNDLFVSDVIHKAFVDVNEEGTEAAAATAVMMMMRCIIIEPEFTADHPFLFSIYDKLTKMVLFLGRLTDPPVSSSSAAKDEL